MRHEPVENPHDPLARQRRVDFDAKSAPRELILDVEHAEPAARLQCVRHEVQHPDRVAPQRFLQWSPCADRALATIERVRRKLKGSDDGDRQMVKVLTAVLTDGLSAVEAACAESLEAGIASADVILNALARRQQPAPAPPVLTPERLTLRIAPTADCARYDSLRSHAAEAYRGAA